MNNVGIRHNMNYCGMTIVYKFIIPTLFIFHYSSFINFFSFLFLFSDVYAFDECHEHFGDMPRDVVEFLELFLGDASEFQQHIEHGPHLACSSFRRKKR